MSASQRTLLIGAFGLVAALAGPARAACPTAALFEPTAPTATFDAGWAGIAHQKPVFGTTLHLAIDCAATDAPCGTCPVTGIVAEPAGHRLRCRNDTSVACSFATEVADCGSPGSCSYYLTPPQPIGAGGLPFCFTTELAGLPSGNVDVESGAFAPTVPVHTRIYYGYAETMPPDLGPTRGCPRCLGDGTADDGVRDGTCESGPRAGLACDANGTSPLDDFGSVSFDCPPPAPVVAQFRSTIAFATMPQTIVLSTASPHCTGSGAPAPLCFCDTCNDAADTPCATNADCPPSGGNPGVCGGRRCIGGSNDGTPCATGSECPTGLCGRLGEPTKPNPCLDDTATGTPCTPDGMGGGFCGAGPIINECSNHPNRGCRFDADCDGVPGSCTSIPRACFPDNGVVGGSVDVDGVATAPLGGVADPTDLGALFCLGSSGFSWVDVWGFPGLARLQQAGRLTLGDAPPGPTPTSTPLPTVTPTPSPAMCPALPDACRTPVVTGKAALQLVDRSPDDKDQLAWKWLRGAGTTVADFGDPLASDRYALCVYDDTGLRAALRIPAAGTCGVKPCWRATPSGFSYKSKDGGPDGLTQLTLRAGASGKAQIQVRGRGAALPLPAPPSLSGAVVIQLRNEASGVCFGATYVPPFDTLTPDRLKDRAD